MGKDACLQILGFGVQRIKNNASIEDAWDRDCEPIFCCTRITEKGDIKKERNKLLRVLESGKPDVKTPASGEGGRERVPPELGPCLSVSVTVTQTRVTWEDGLLAEGFDCLAHKSIGHSS